MTPVKACKVVVVALALVAAKALAQDAAEPATTSEEAAAENSNASCVGQRYTFSWNLTEACFPDPRGGTSTGAPVTLADEPYPGWEHLQEEGISDLERDRRAILAMAGPYRVSFEFIETIGYTPGFQPSVPYQSWGTEYVYVVENTAKFISLQHIMVMFFMDGDEVVGPMVMKHWRQDWRYEEPTLLEYAGHNTWEIRELPEQAVEGTWTQTVYQVDDSPRYASYGAWQHYPNFSTWESHLTRRPLPRRESSVRDDYDVLEGYNRHSIVPNGWVQEEENYKLRLTPQGEPQEQLPYVAKEIGVNRYERIADFDFAAGDAYWKETSAYWAIVKEEWQRLIKNNNRLTVKPEYRGRPLFEPLFNLANQWRTDDLKPKQVRQRVRGTLADYVEGQSR